MHLKMLKRRQFLQGFGLSTLSFFFTFLSQNKQVRAQGITWTLEVVSHGAPPADNSNFTLFENNWQLKFFTKEGETLDFRDAFNIHGFFKIDQISEVESRVKNIKFSGARVLDYEIWLDEEDEEELPSGVYKAGEETPFMGINGSLDQPIRLSEVLNQVIDQLDINNEEDTVVVYFNACRGETDDFDGCDLVSPGAPSLAIGCEN